MKIEILIKPIRINKKLSLERLSKMTGISSTHINDVENNLKQPGISILIRIAYALKVDITEIYIKYIGKMKTKKRSR